MVFGAWQPLDQAGATAPPVPGVLQIRGDALIDLPRGKSAMILYAASQTDEPLDRFVTGPGAALLARAAGEGARYVRFAPAARPQHELLRLLANFDERFGALPPANRTAPARRS